MAWFYATLVLLVHLHVSNSNDPQTLYYVSNASDLYVSPAGSDDNSGRSPSTPVKTLEHLATLLKNGDTVHVQSSNYQLNKSIKINIPNTNWLTTGGKVSISGGRQLSSWSVSKLFTTTTTKVLQTSVAKLSLTSATRHLYVNKRRIPRARLSMDDLNEIFNGSTITPQGYAIKSSNISSLLRTGSEAVFPQSTSPWTEPRCAVISSNSTDVLMAQPCWSNLIHKPCGQNVKGPPQYVEGVGPSNIISPGEWALSDDAQTLYYSPLPMEDPTTIVAVVPVLETLLEIDQSGDGTTFNGGFVFEHATWLRPGLGDGYVEQQTGQCTIGTSPNNNNCNKDLWRSVKSPGNIQITNASNVAFHKCEFTRLGGFGLDFTFSPNAVVDSCYFHDISGSGVQIGQFQYPLFANLDPHSTISNNIINKAGAEYSGAAGINVGYTQNITIVRNDVSNLTYTPITVGWGWSSHECWNCTNAGNSTIGWNNVHDYKQTLNDGGGIYMLGPQNGSWVFENYVHHQGTASSGALYPDEGSAYSKFERNVVTDIGGSKWLHLWNPSIHNVTVINNYADTSRYENHGTNCPMINNTIFWPSGKPPKEARHIMDAAGVNSTNPWYELLN